MPKKSIAKNYVFNVLYQIFILFTPLITTPYLSRILKPEGIGQYSFTASLAFYFTLFASLGFGLYAQREIANHQGDKAAQTRIFYEILLLRFCSTAISTLISCSLAWAGVYQNYTNLMWLWLIQIAASEVDITFFFQGNEEFGKIVLRNILVKTLTIVLVFTLIKDASQVWIYVLLMAGSTFLGNLSLWLYLPKYLAKVALKDLHPWHHFIPTFKLFIPTIATSLYTLLDKTLIGLLITDTYTAQETVIVNGVSVVQETTKRYADLENGYYEQAGKIVTMALTIITSLGTVMIPRNSQEFSSGHLEQVKKNVYFATNFVWILGIPLMLGIAAIAPNIIPWFLGPGYEKCVLLMQLFSPLVLLIGLSNVFGLQYLIPTKQDKKYTIGILSGAVTNLILNFVLIHYYWSLGAIIATLCAELMVSLIMALLVRKEIDWKAVFLPSWKCWIAGLLMFGSVYATAYFLAPSWSHSLLLILEGIAIYIILIFLLRDFFALTSLKKVLGWFHAKKKNDSAEGSTPHE